MTQVQTQFVTISQLRIGMYVYLDMGWMDHPFSVGHFEIRTEQQLQQLRSLGLARIRYAPEKSVNPVTDDQAVPPVVDVPVVTEESAQVTQTRLRRALIANQHASLLACERQFTHATQTFKQLSELVHDQAVIAKEQATQLVMTLLEGILGEEEATIRLLSEKAGEKTAQHSVNVTLISLLLGKTLEIPKTEMLELGVGALLHDIGKMALPDRLRWLDESFSASERQLYQSHVVHGVTIARKMGLSSSATILIAQHHEYADGSGYPGHISVEKMTNLSRIISLVNRYDNLCNPGDSHSTMTPHEAMSQLFAKNRSQFDQTVMTAFIKMMGIYPPGSVVQLNDERYALVVSVNSTRPIKPRVIIHDPTIPVADALIVNLEHEDSLSIRRSLKPIQLPRDVFDYLTPRKRLNYFYERANEFPPHSDAHTEVPT